MMKVASPPRLSTIFSDNKEFAWDMLECQIKIESNPNITGAEIAELLSFYMRAVERLNSAHDSREIYFRNKVNTLMIKPNVMRVMVNSGKKSVEQQKTTVQKATAPVVEEPQKPNFYSNLQSKKMEMEMHMTYESQGQLSQDKLKKMMVQHDTQAQLIESKVNEVITDNRNKMEDRIKQRKLKAQSARSKSQKTLQFGVYKPQMNGIEAIKEEQEEPVIPKKKPTGNKRSNSAEIKINPADCPESPTQKTGKQRRRSTIVDVHYRLTLD